MKGLFHWRLLGAHLLRRRAGCLQPENSGPFVLATARTLGCLRAPAPLCGAPANQSYPIDLTSRHHQPHARRPIHRVLSDPPRNGLAVLPKEKRDWRSEACDGALGSAPPHSAAGPQGPAAIA